ncbi:MAG: VOC family protein [Proteobacteria bacterium]|uniref:VOC family protein n=1 Tax=Candidatus Avisuccinivibrio stercorigallinarum TaxID=2840704 RepID=A0A9D9DAU4_9GAMM|nr:VOC family protein [Candidatus Avisuccinivibrio stercorigallinarum]
MKIEHIALYVQDLEGAKDFFMRFFAAVPSALYHNHKTSFKSYFLSFEDGARLEIMTSEDLSVRPVSDRHNGFIHLCFSLGCKEAVDAKTGEFRQAGFAVLSGPRTTGDGYYESVIEGFEGNLIELTV